MIREGEMNITSGIWAGYCCAGEAGVHLLREWREQTSERRKEGRCQVMEKMERGYKN